MSLYTTDAFHLPKRLEILDGSQMETPVSICSDRNIWDHSWRWPTLIGQTGRNEICLSIITNRFVALLFFSIFSFVCGTGERNRKWQEQFLSVGPVWSENVVPFFPSLVPLVSGRSVWKAPNISECCAGTDEIWANARKRQLIKSNAEKFLER